MSCKVTKIVLIGIMGNGKSSVANLFAGYDYFKVSNGADSCTLNISSYKNGDIEIFDTEGLNSTQKNDVENLQNMILRFKKEQMNAIFIVHNGEICRIDESLEKVIRQICKLFIGKYIWKQIGIIFTHYGYDIDDQNEIKGREKNFVKKILNIAEKEYKNIESNQNENFKTCDKNEKLIDTLKCFYVNAKKKKNQYDANTLNEIEKIKNLARSYPSITKIQSKFEIRREVLKDQKGNPENILKRQSKTGFIAGLQRLGFYSLGVCNAISTPAWLLGTGVCKGIGLAFDENSSINKIGDIYFELVKGTPKFFGEIPEENIGTEIIGSETRYDIYDLQIIYYSNGEIEHNIINVRPQVITNS